MILLGTSQWNSSADLSFPSYGSLTAFFYSPVKKSWNWCLLTMNSRREISSRFTNDIQVCLATQMAWCWFQPIGKRYLVEDWRLINSEQSLFSRSESEREKWRKQWRPCRRSFPFSLARPRANSPFPFPFNACHAGYIWPCSRYIFNSLCQITLSNHVSTRRTNFYSVLLFISFDTWTSTLHFTEIRTLHSILTWRISPVTASYFKLNLVYFQLNFWIFVYALVIIGRDKISLCGGGRWRPIGLHPRLFRPSCFVKKRSR